MTAAAPNNGETDDVFKVCWLPRLGSNQGFQLQRLACYHYTTGQRRSLQSIVLAAMACVKPVAGPVPGSLESISKRRDCSLCSRFARPFHPHPNPPLRWGGDVEDGFWEGLRGRGRGAHRTRAGGTEISHASLINSHFVPFLLHFRSSRVCSRSCADGLGLRMGRKIRNSVPFCPISSHSGCASGRGGYAAATSSQHTGTRVLTRLRAHSQASLRMRSSSCRKSGWPGQRRRMNPATPGQRAASAM